MSKQEEHNRSLHDLLKNKQQEPDDAFEKEAREGFDLLEDHEQAFELKAATDARINKELFAPRRERTVFYWAAAASVLLFVGFVVYFFSDFSRDEKTFAIKQPESKKDVAPLPSQPQIITAPAESQPERQEVKKTIRREPDQKTQAGARSFEAEQADVTNMEKPALEEQQAAPADADQMAAAVNEPAKKEEAYVVNTRQDDNVNEGKSAAAADQHQKSKKAKQAQEPPAASPARMQNERMESEVTVQATYPGGPQQLSKEVSEKLSKKNTLVEFAATLFIGENGNVEKVEFTGDKGLTKQQKKIVREELLTLKKFQVTPNNSAVSYELKFTP